MSQQFYDYKKKRLIEKEMKSLYRFVSSPSFLPADEHAANPIVKSVIKQHLSGSFAKRRREALLRYLDKAEKDFADLGCANLDKVFIETELYPINDYNVLDATNALRIGAALWILQELKDAGKLEEVQEFIPSDLRGKRIFLPDKFYHPCFSNDMIELVVFLITMRFVLEAPKKLKEPDLQFIVATSENAEGMEPNRVFESFLALLPAERVQSVCDEFRKKVWDLSRRCLKGQFYLQDKLERYVSNAKRTIKVKEDTNPLDVNRMLNPVGPVANPSEAMLKRFAVPVSCNPANSLFPLLSSGWFIGDMDRNYIDPAFSSYLLDGQKMERDTMSFVTKFDKYLRMGHDKVLEITGNSLLAESVDGFTVNDPYAMCFALFYLIDHHDDAPWLFRSGGSLMRYVLSMLPYAPVTSDDYSSMCDGSYVSGVFEENGLDLYHSYFGDMNLAQVLYRINDGAVVSSPVVIPAVSQKHPLMNRGDLSFRVVAGCMSWFLSQVKEREAVSAVLGSDSDDSADVEEEEDEEEVLADEADCDGAEDVSLGQLVLELSKAKKEIKNLKQVLAETRQESADTVAEKDKEIQRLQREHTELVDLRELVFSQESLEQVPADDVDSDSDISYPYETKHRVVVFGGHDTFLKVIKPMFPTVRFVDTRNVSFNPDIVRNADIVWIQNNCISHSQFWTVIKLANLYGVQVRYFASAGTDRCAKQLVEADMLAVG